MRKYCYPILVLILSITYLSLVVSYWKGDGYQEKKASSTELSRVIVDSEYFVENGLIKTAGINQYTHYPETPAYIIYFLTRALGFSPLDFALPFRLLTTVPLNLVALISISWLLRKSKWSYLLIIPLFIMVFQKGISHWSGNLEQEAYALGIGLLGIPLGFFAANRSDFLTPLVYGFVITSFSFDYSIVSGLTFTASYLLRQSQASYKSSLYCFLFILLGSLSTLFLHFIQVVCHYNSFALAFNDLFGSALARMNIFNNLNPHYSTVMRNSLPSNFSYWKTILTPIWYLPSAASHLFRVVFLFVAGITSIRLLRFRQRNKSKILIAFLLAFIGLFAWCMLFPNHAQMHNYHFIPRHSFIFFCFCLVFLVELENYEKDLKCQNSFTHKFEAWVNSLKLNQTNVKITPKKS
ncbi:MAG: hypothetical protein QNJ31_03590 [Candidatus Caenarcaniphilales bacterium]|nr:hypothetical protein [Candidatus Caenarcaniphilales bacterium]